MASAADVIRALALEPHPEGGHFREVYRALASAGTRGAATSIYYLLGAGERSHWHKVDAVELWHHYAGDPLRLAVSEDGRTVSEIRLGANVLGDERPLGVVPEGAWQSAESLGAWTLVGCTVAPAFEFAGFEMAPPGWKPGS